ncbi:hypothetical protein ACF0H5_004632 [Mactra antiquata]
MPKLGRRSERTGLDYQMASDLVRKDAPFGNDDTGIVTTKIIGGKTVHVMDRTPQYNQDYGGGSRIQLLRPIADKPNHLDPRIHGDNPGGYYNKDTQSSPSSEYPFGSQDLISPRPTTYFSKRPDSKDVVRGQFRALPPIQQNRTRNDMSTVFEAEPWTDNVNPPFASDTEYKQNYFPGQGDNFDFQDYTGGGKDHYVTDYEKQQLLGLIPKKLLPVDPIKLSREQEVTLCKLICNELNRFDPRELKEIYLECSRHDKNLEGYCLLEVLGQAAYNHKAYLSDTLRLVSAQFVDPNRQGYVNYEKVLSFIGSALKLNDKGQLQSGPSSREKHRQRDFPEKTRDHNSREKRHERNERHVGEFPSYPSTSYTSSEKYSLRSDDKHPKYYMQNGESLKTGSLYGDREIAKLLHIVEQQLAAMPQPFKSEKWENAFRSLDRQHRGTLSAVEIKDICYDEHLTLSDSVLNRILAHCESGNRTGQYSWEKFLKFFERLRPTNTGLPIPRKDASPRRDLSPRRSDYRPDDRGQSPVKQTSPKTEQNIVNGANGTDRYDRDRDRDTYRRDRREDSYRESYRPNGGGGGGGRGDETNRSREEQINQLSYQIKDLEKKYQITKDGMRSNDKPWNERYILMAQALYNSDFSNKGSLPQKDVMEIVKQYNSAFNLGLDIDRAMMMSISPENLDKSNNVILRTFLANLSADRTRSPFK